MGSSRPHVRDDPEAKDGNEDGLMRRGGRGQFDVGRRCNRSSRQPYHKGVEDEEPLPSLEAPEVVGRKGGLH